MNPRIQPSPRSAAPPQKIWKPLELIKVTHEYLKKRGIESSRLEAEWLLADVLNCDRVKLYVDFEMPILPEDLDRYRGYVKRRAEGREPLQYILGNTDFLNLRLMVRPGVLIPRPETEELVTWAIETLEQMAQPELKILDLGTGSGCIALCLASKLKTARVVAVDVSPDAIAVASENAKQHELDEQVEFLEGNLFDTLPVEMQGCFDMIVSNPPYIDPALVSTLAPEVRDHEPGLALFANERGIEISRRIIADASVWLRIGGHLALEISPEQVSLLKELLEEAGFGEISVRQDFKDLNRFISAIRMK